MRKNILTALVAFGMAGCATTSGPQFVMAPDLPEIRASHRKQITELVKRYDHFQHYIFSQPKELIVREALFGKIAGLFGTINKEKAQYCIFLKLYDPENDTLLSQTTRTFKANIMQQVDNPQNTKVSVETINNKSMDACRVAESTPIAELSGHVFKRN